MDKIMRITLWLFIVILAVFTGILSFNGYVENTYRNTITGTYTYSCTIATDAPLYNLTLFIPVPADRTGNSPMVSDFSSRMMSGVPAEWETTLFDTGKATMLKVTTRAVIPPEGTTASNPYSITFSSETVLHSPMETLDPVAKGVIFRPVQALNEIGCPPGQAGNGTRCFSYTTSVYAEYGTAADTTMSISSAVNGKNSWKIFEPRSNEYQTAVSLSLKGENHGWAEMAGRLSSGTGIYDAPAISWS